MGSRLLARIALLTTVLIRRGGQSIDMTDRRVAVLL